MSQAEQETRAPHSDVARLNHADFGQPTVSWVVRKSISMLPEGKRVVLFAAARFQISLRLWDLLGIALIGLVAAVSVSGMVPESLPDWAKSLLSFFVLDSLTVSQLSVAIALTPSFQANSVNALELRGLSTIALNSSFSTKQRVPSILRLKSLLTKLWQSLKAK